MSKSNAATIIFNLKDKDVSLIRDDLSLHFDGCEIVYFVDPYDVIEFVLPSLLDHETLHLTDKSNASSQAYIAYDYFFLRSSHTPVIAQEYKVELSSLFRVLQKDAEQYVNPVARDKFVESFIKLSNDQKALERKLGTLLIYAIGLLDANIIDRINQLSKRLRENVPRGGTDREQVLLEDVMLTTKATSRVDDVFDLFCKREQFKLSTLKPDDKDIYLENTFRDIEVIDRIIEINKRILSSNGLKQKYIIQYLSSSSYKSPILFELFLQIMDESGAEPESYKILRNIHHFNLLASIQKRSLGRNDAMSEIESLNTISKHVSERISITEDLSHQYDEITRKFENTRSFSKNNLEDTYTLYQVFTIYQTKTLQALEELNKGSASGLQSLLNKLYSYLDKNHDQNERVQIALENYNDDYDIKNKILKIFSSLSSSHKFGAVNFSVYPGKDPIRSHMQLYPILLFHKELLRKGNNILSSLLLHIASPVSHKKSFMLEKYSDAYSYEYFTLANFERKIFSLLLQVILPLPTDNKNEGKWLRMTEERYSNERTVIEELEKIDKINNKRLSRYVLNENTGNTLPNLEVFFFPHKTVKCELMYFLSWMYRRTGDYEKGKNLLNDAAIVEFEDPRLYHSRALILISEAYETDSVFSKEKIEKFAGAIADLWKAKGFFLTQQGNEAKLVSHVLIGIDNTICDAYVQIYLLNSEYDDLILEKARILLNELKHSLHLLGENYENYPTYNHTEADLEYCEAFYFFKSGLRDAALSRIEACIERFEGIDRTGLLQDNQFVYLSSRRIQTLAKKIYRGK